MIEILIQTYNRDTYIKDNLKILIDEINKNNLKDKISILISNNCSTDHTKPMIEEIIDKTDDICIFLYNQKMNIGLEANALFLLEQAKDVFIVFLGDDDYLPSNYLNYLIDKINSYSDLTCVLPGLNSLLPNQHIIPGRIESFKEKMYLPSFHTVAKLSHIGHQMSGVLLKRKRLFEKYMADQELRNIYPFIYFVSYNLLEGRTIYSPEYKVLVSVGNTKDWSYDKSGLVTEVFKNYKILFAHSCIKRNYLNNMFMYKQQWRLRIDRGPKSAMLSFWHILYSKNTELCTKITLPFLYIYLYLRLLSRQLKKLFLK